MRCQPVACLWHDGGGSPIHQHKITAHAILNEPSTLYTGGSDGSIVWWNIHHSQHQQRSAPSAQQIWPMAMLCGHAAAIVALEICTPIANDGQIHSSRDVNSTPAGSSAIMSACSDGVLCVWSRGSGHCRRRRKLPPWVGTPCVLSSLPLSSQYVCVACNFADAVHNLPETAEMGNDGHLQSDTATDKEMHPKRISRCAIVVVDSCTLNIVRTIAQGGHGGLSVGPLKFMAVVPSCEDARRQSVIVVDTLGKLQSIAIPESDPNGEPRSVLQRSSSHVGPLAECENLQLDELDGLQAASVSANGKLLALVFRTQCTFKSMTTMTTIGVISLAGSSLCDDGPLTQGCLAGGMFLHSHCSQALGGVSVEKFAVWSNTGAAIVYKVSNSAAAFDFELLYEIPAATSTDCLKMSVSFCQLNYYIFRMESLCFEMHTSTLWQPRISIWSASQLPMGQINSIGTISTMKSNNSDDSFSCSMVGEGSFLTDEIGRTNSLSETEALNSSVPRYGFLSSGRMISSSLVLSEDFYVPHAVVYGFYSGDIEVVHFEMFHHEMDLVDDSLHQNIGSQKSDQSFLGHRGAVLCLAAHRMTTTLGEPNFKQVLISGSSDCTIRIWDLDTGRLLSVMQHHVAPVKQIILPPPQTCHPWSDCFLSVGEDSCVSLASLETLRVERMFPGHPSYPVVVWDSTRDYIACLCKGMSALSDPTNALYLWDVKTGACERVLHGNASHSMFDNFCRGINVNYITGNILGGSTSASSLLLPVNEDTSLKQSHTYLKKGTAKATPAGNAQRRTAGVYRPDVSLAHENKGKILISRTTHEFSSHATDHSFMGQTPLHAIHHKNHLIKCSCPYPGIATLKFDLLSLMHSHPWDEKFIVMHNDCKQENARVSGWQLDEGNFHQTNSNGGCDLERNEKRAWVRSPEGCLLRFSISFLHLWDVDQELDKLLTDEMNVCKPQNFIVASGLQGDRGSLTLAFPGMGATLELWRSSSEFCAMRSLAMVSLAQGMIRLSRSSSAASSALAAFYTRSFAEKVPDIKPPLLQLLVSFWQDPSEHIRMAARSLFHCAASRSIPLPLSGPRLTPHAIHSSFINGDINKNMGDASLDNLLGSDRDDETQVGDDEHSILEWMELFEMQDWVSCIGATGQDARASHIIVAAALVVWYPSLVKPNLAKLVVHPLMKLVMAMNDKYSSTAAELLAEGMESMWKACIGHEIPQLITDIFFQIECVSGAPANKAMQNSSLAITMRESLAGILLPSIAMADISGFLNVIESQIWATASDSPVHLVSLMTLIRVIRGSPKPLSLHLDKAVNFILQTMDHGNSVMRRTCLQSSMAALREVVRVFPMVALNEASTRLAVGDVIGDIHSANIRIYDMQSLTKIKVLDASGPPGLPNLLRGASDMMITTVISALSFSPDGEGLVAFSEHGLMIRWWSLGTGWWEKLNRNIVPVQCTKLIFVPPWEGFSPNSSRSSIMASIISNDSPAVLPGQTGSFGDNENSKLLIHSLDLSYRLQWVSERKVVLARHGQELGSFQF